MTNACIGIGSNIHPEENLREAARRLRARWPGIRFSSVYASPAAEVEDQPDFLNAVARIETTETPDNITEYLRTIEQERKKKPPYRFGPRTIDLDLLLYGDEVKDSETLTLPHPRMSKRRFVLLPLTELVDPDTQHPTLRKSWKALLAATEDQVCERVALAL